MLVILLIFHYYLKLHRRRILPLTYFELLEVPYGNRKMHKRMKSARFRLISGGIFTPLQFQGSHKTTI